MPPKKREVTIRFVTAARGAKISAIIDVISEHADDVSITCKTVGSRRTATRRGRSAPPASNGADHADPAQTLPQHRRPQLVYRADESGNRSIDVDASLVKLGLTRDELQSRRWERGSPQHRLKQPRLRVECTEPRRERCSMKIVGFRCPCCRRFDWRYAARGERHFVECQSCGLSRLLLVRPLPPQKRSIPLDLFPTAGSLASGTLHRAVGRPRLPLEP